MTVKYKIISLLSYKICSVYVVMSKEKEIFTKNFAKFCNILRDEDSLLPHFVEKQIISVGDLTDIRSKPYTDKASTLLRHISSPLDIGYTKGFYDLLDIMIDYGRPHTKDFAEKIKHQCSNYSDGELYSVATL